jgi:hypothetical protein
MNKIKCGQIAMKSDENAAVPDKAGLDDRGREALVANRHLYRFADRGCEGQAGKGDRLLHGRRETAAGDFAVAVGRLHRLVSPQHAAVLQHQTEKLVLPGSDEQGSLADEVARDPKSTVQARPASSGETVSSMSWP